MGEISYNIPTRKGFQNLSGQVYERLTVLEWSHRVRHDSGKVSHYYLCKCDCGEDAVIQADHLRSGATTSCGCYKKEREIERATKHGLTNHPLYDRCFKIIHRCYSPNSDVYHNYGGREQSDPIYVQESWKNDIGLMVIEIEAEIGLPPFKKAHIDRKENNLGYESGNIHWVTPRENAQNKRNTHLQCVDPVTRKPTPTYNAWTKLIGRYGDEVCIEWRSDGNCETNNGFKNFYRDMGEKPRKISPIKRHDESLPFCKQNCYWA